MWITSYVQVYIFKLIIAVCLYSPIVILCLRNIFQDIASPRFSSPNKCAHLNINLFVDGHTWSSSVMVRIWGVLGPTHVK